MPEDVHQLEVNMQTAAKSVSEYLEEVPEERKAFYILGTDVMEAQRELLKAKGISSSGRS